MEFKTSKQNINRKPSMEQNLLTSSFKFTKENVKYGILFKFPDGAFLINYDDEQYPIIPFAFESYDSDLNNSMKYRINQYNYQKIENNKIKSNNLLEISRLNAKIKNNDYKGNFNYTELRSQIDGLKKNVQALTEKNKNKGIYENSYKGNMQVQNQYNYNYETLRTGFNQNQNDVRNKFTITHNLIKENKEYKNIGNYRYQNQNQNQDDVIDESEKNIYYSNYNSKKSEIKYPINNNLQNQNKYQNIRQYRNNQNPYQNIRQSQNNK